MVFFLSPLHTVFATMENCWLGSQPKWRNGASALDGALYFIKRPCHDYLQAADENMLPTQCSCMHLFGAYVHVNAHWLQQVWHCPFWIFQVFETELAWKQLCSSWTNHTFQNLKAKSLWKKATDGFKKETTSRQRFFKISRQNNTPVSDIVIVQDTV